MSHCAQAVEQMYSNEVNLNFAFEKQADFIKLLYNNAYSVLLFTASFIVLYLFEFLYQNITRGRARETETESLARAAACVNDKQTMQFVFP